MDIECPGDCSRREKGEKELICSRETCATSNYDGIRRRIADNICGCALARAAKSECLNAKMLESKTDALDDGLECLVNRTFQSHPPSIFDISANVSSFVSGSAYRNNLSPTSSGVRARLVLQIDASPSESRFALFPVFSFFSLFRLLSRCALAPTVILPLSLSFPLPVSVLTERREGGSNLRISFKSRSSFSNYFFTLTELKNGI